MNILLHADKRVTEARLEKHCKSEEQAMKYSADLPVTLKLHAVLPKTSYNSASFLAPLKCQKYNDTYGNSKCNSESVFL